MRVSPLSFFFVLAFSLSSVTIASAQSWTSYSPESCFCSFKLPGEAEIEMDESDKTATSKHSVIYNEVVYLFASTEHTLPLNDPEGLAITSLESFNETLKGRIIRKEPWKVKKHSGYQATIQVPEQNAACQYKVVIAGQFQYQMVVIASVGGFDDKVAKKFFKSIKIKQ